LAFFNLFRANSSLQNLWENHERKIYYNRYLEIFYILLKEKSKTNSPDRSKNKINFSRTNDSMDSEEAEHSGGGEEFLSHEIKVFREKLNVN